MKYLAVFFLFVSSVALGQNGTYAVSSALCERPLISCSAIHLPGDTCSLDLEYLRCVKREQKKKEQQQEEKTRQMIREILREELETILNQRNEK